MTKLKTFFNKLSTKIKSYDLFSNAKMFFIPPLVIILAMIICGCFYQFTNTKFDKFANISVDFQGGTMLTVEFSGADDMNTGDNYTANVALIESVLNEYGFSLSTWQSSGDSAIIVKYLNTATINGEIIDYSVDEKVEEMNELNTEIGEAISTKVTETYGVDVSTSSTATVIGNSASIKLLKTALISVAVSLALILLYIIIRFDLYSGLAAICALLHDVIIMMSFTVIFYVEIGSTIVAAIITIVAYSINNTIVVFDKVRSTIKPYKKSGGKYIMGDVINHSVRATMTRTLYTTLTTAVAISLITILGVTSIQNFALPILFGLIAGFYSSVFLAAPMWGFFKEAGINLKKKMAIKKFQKEHSPIEEKKPKKLKAKKA
jgi:preprotein translocase subunit SecF